MQFLRINGWAVEVLPGSADFDVQWMDGDFRSELGQQVLRRRRRKTRWTFRTTPITASKAETLEGIVAGLGHVWSFESTTAFPFSSRGRAPLATGTLTRSTTVPRFGSACGVVTGSVVWDLSKGVAPLLDRWTLMFWRDTSGVGTAWTHYVVRSDGAVWVNGVRDDTISTSWLTVFDGFLTISDTGNRYDDLVALCFAADDEAIEAWYEWEIDEGVAFSDLPELAIDGAVIDGDSMRAIGVVNPQDIVTYVDEAVGDFLNNPRVVSFALHARRVEPTPILPAVAIYLSMDDEEGDPPRSQISTGQSAWTKTGGVTFGAAGQVEECASYDGTGYVSPPNSSFLSTSVTTSIAHAIWIRADASVAENRAVLGKVATGVAGYVWFMRPVSGGLEVVYRMQNSAATLFREISGGVVPLDEWHHIAVVHVANATRFEIYIDGERVETVTRVLTLSTSITNAEVARLGGVNLPTAAAAPAAWEVQLRDPLVAHAVDLDGVLPGAIFGWLGDLDEFIAVSAALTEAQVRHLYDAGADKKRPIFVSP